MHITLTPELEKLVQERIATGQYDNASEVVREALRLLIRRDEVGLYHEEWLAAEVEIGWQQADRGETEPHDMSSIVDEALGRRR